MDEELTLDEKLALLEAMSKQIKPVLDDAKADAKQQLLDSFAETHADRRAILVNSQKVGEISISFGKPKAYILPGHEEKALEYLAKLGLVEQKPKVGWEKRFRLIGDLIVDEETGEDVSELFGWDQAAPKSAAVRGCKPQDVVDAFQGRLASVPIAAFIEGSVE